MNLKPAISAINKHGILLVFPIANQTLPRSLWSCFYPRSKMRWEWDEDGDNRVAGLWHLRAALFASGKVVYAKWYQGRATFFSRDVYAALLSKMHGGNPAEACLSPQASELYGQLLENSPQSTKQLKKQAIKVLGWENKVYERSMCELWERFFIVGCGEVDDGAFPSLSVGATQYLFEELWERAHTQKPDQRDTLLKKKLPPSSLFYKHYQKMVVKYQGMKRTSQGKRTTSAKKGPKGGVLFYGELVGHCPISSGKRS